MSLPMFVLKDVPYTTTTIVVHLIALWLLSSASSTQQTAKKTRDGRPSEVLTRWVALIRALGIFAAVLLGCLPFVVKPDDPLQQAGLRALSFFMAARVLELTVVYATTPPKLSDPPMIWDISTHIRYVWLLLTEWRYRSFDIAVRQKNRQPHSKTWFYGPFIAVPLSLYLYPTAETKCLTLLLLISSGFEALRTICHGSPEYPLFWYPFAASSFSSFWTTHWHSGAESWLRSLGYDPAYRLARSLGLGKQVARALGVIGAFNLSGIWHGWAAGAVTTEPWMLGIQVWILMIGMAMGCIIEQVVWSKDRQGNLLHRVVTWIIALSMAGWAYRELQSTSTIPWLKTI